MKVEQRTEYRRPDGTLSADFDDAITVTTNTVLTLAGAHCKTIPPGFVLGVATRESSKNGRLCANMICTDYRDGVALPLPSIGLLQLRQDDVPAECVDLCDPETNIAAGVTVLESKLARILEAAKLHYVSIDVLKYLAWSHNQGLAPVLRSIKLFGLDFQELVNRPDNRSSPYVRSRLVPYCATVVDYAARYPLEPATAAG